MSKVRSIRFRLLSVFFLGIVLVLVLGLISLWRLTGYHVIAANIRDVYLPNTQFLGDLNNFTSDFRAAEAAALLAVSSADRDDNRAEIEGLDRRITLAEHSYEHVPNDPSEQDLFRDFAEKWRLYRQKAGEVLTLSAASHPAEARDLYGKASRTSYDAASNALDVLTERNRLSARAASQRADAAYEQAMWLIVAGVLLSGAILLSGLTFFRRSILLPLLKLVQVMHRLAEQDMGIEIEDTGRPDEIGEMARAVQVFHSNAIELGVNQRALAEQASLLGEKLAHEKRLTELQRSFVSMASHEFRTPLTIIDGQAQRLVNTRTRAKPEDIAERAGIIREAVSRMTGVMTNLIDSARLIEDGAELFVHPVEFDLARVLHEVCQLYRDMAPRTRIVDRIGPDPLTMIGDPKLLFQVFSNMMSNAVKYSPENGVVRVGAEPRGDDLLVTIQDQGVGIPAEDRTRLFDRYFRGSNVAGIGGTGIGLYLVKTVIDLHGGEVSVESSEGKGSVFSVRLPSRPARGGVATTPPDAAE